jgi:hypothetical protein
MAVAVMASVRNWRRVAKSMLRGDGWFGGVVSIASDFQLFGLLRK